MQTEPTINWNGTTNRTPNNTGLHPARRVDGRYDGTATEKQIAFLRSLAQEVGKVAELEADLAKGAGPSKRRASAMIERLLELKQQAPAPAPAPAQPSTPVDGLDLTVLSGGYYAATVDGVTKFFRIDRVTEGRWEGWTFVKIQASDDLHRQGAQRPGQAYSGASTDYLREIVRDENAAFALYGQKLGRCGVCGRTLTDETSREIGIGPICREKVAF